MILNELVNTFLPNQNHHKNYYQRKLSAFSRFKLIEQRSDSNLLEVEIITGRPHQIRIHLAAFGNPLIGDPLYKVNGEISNIARPGQGGYCLHSYKIDDLPIYGNLQSFQALPPKELRLSSNNV